MALEIDWMVKVPVLGATGSMGPGVMLAGRTSYPAPSETKTRPVQMQTIDAEPRRGTSVHLS